MKASKKQRKPQARGRSLTPVVGRRNCTSLIDLIEMHGLSKCTVSQMTIDTGLMGYPIAFHVLFDRPSISAAYSPNPSFQGGGTL